MLDFQELHITRNGNDECQSYNEAIAKVAKGGAILFTGATLSKTFGFLRQLIIIRMLSPYHYGLIALGLTFLSVSASISILGLSQGVQRFIAYYRSREELSKVKGAIYSSAKITALSSVFCAIMILVFSNNISDLFSMPDLEYILMIFSLAIPISVGASMIISFFLGFKLPEVIVWLECLFFGVPSVLLVFLSLLITRNVYAPVIALVVAFLICFMASLYAYRRFIAQQLREIIPYHLGKSLLVFSLPLIFTTFASMIMANTDTLMLGYYMSADSVGFYNAAFLLMQSIPIVLISLGAIFMPVATSLIGGGHNQRVNNLYQSVTKWLFVLTLPLFLIFFLFPSSILVILFGNAYAEAAVALGILAAGEFIHIFFGPNSHLLIAYGKTKVLMTSSIAASLANLVLNIILIPRFGISGAAIATGVSLALMNIFNSTYLYVKLNIHPFHKPYTITVSLLVLSSAFLYVPLNKLISYSNWFFILCYPIFLSLGIFFILITKSYSEEDRLVLELVKRKLLSFVGKE